MIIGSGDIAKLLSGLKTKGYRELWQKFTSLEPPYYNALASPIKATRAGAILELRYVHYLGDDYYTQVKASVETHSVLMVSLDFAKREKGKIVDFEELKTIFLPDFIDLIKPMKDRSKNEVKAFLKKNFKKYYNQFQSELLATDLPEATMVFVSVKSYEDDENYNRIIKDNDVVKFRVSRDEEVIELIKRRLGVFQTVKDHFDLIE